MIIKFTYIYNRKITVKSLSSFRDIFILTSLKYVENAFLIIIFKLVYLFIIHVKTGYSIV